MKITNRDDFKIHFEHVSNEATPISTLLALQAEEGYPQPLHGGLFDFMVYPPREGNDYKYVYNWSCNAKPEPFSLTTYLPHLVNIPGHVQHKIEPFINLAINQFGYEFASFTHTRLSYFFYLSKRQGDESNPLLSLGVQITARTVSANLYNYETGELLYLDELTESCLRNAEEEILRKEKDE